MNRISSFRFRRASMIPLMPSPGSPNTTSTPQFCRVSINTSDAVIFIKDLFSMRCTVSSAAAGNVIGKPDARLIEVVNHTSLAQEKSIHEDEYSFDDFAIGGRAVRVRRRL